MSSSPERSECSAITGSTSFESMPSVLYPVRAVPDHFGDGDHDRKHSIYSSSSFESSVSSSVRWMGMTPLAMIEMLAATTVEKESEATGYTADPLRIGNINLAAKTSLMKFPSDMAAPNSPNSPMSFFSSSEEERTTPESRERKHGVKSSPPPSSQDTAHQAWDLRPFAEHDPYAAPVINKIAVLSVVLESEPNLDKIIQSYRRTQEHFVNSFHWVMEQYHRDPTCDGREQRDSLTMLYNETIQKMEALIEMARPKDLSQAKQPARGEEQPFSPSFASPSPHPKPVSSSPKHNLSSYMTNWLRDNWTNPYPDDQGVAEMAQDCDTTPSVVSNWLINARTRKWRPAILSAYMLKRSADHLLDDSISIFDGRPIPGFEHVDIPARRQPRAKRSRHH